MTPSPGPRVAALVLAAITVLAGCSGSAGADADVTPIPLSDAQLEGAATTLVHTHGGPEGFALALVAIDQGYSAAQIVDHADAVTWTSLDTPVLPVEPASDSAGVLVAPDSATAQGAAPVTLAMAFAPALRTAPNGAAQDLLIRHPGEQTLAIIDAATDWVVTVEQTDTAAQIDPSTSDASYEEMRAVLYILALTHRGYSPEQVIAAIVLDDVAIQWPGTCPFIPGEAPQFMDQSAETGQCPAIEGSGEDGTGSGDEGDGPENDASGDAAGAASWTGPIVVDEDLFGEVSDSYIAIDRTGDGYALSLFIESTRGPVGDCAWSIFHEADAAGTLSPDGSAIDFTGSYAIDETVTSGGSCAESDVDGEFTMTADVSGGTITGSPFPYTEFSLSGDAVAP